MDTLQKILELLNKDIIRKKIDEPIDHAVSTFHFDALAPVHHKRFNQLLTAFVKHIYTTALRPSVPLSEKKAFEEAVWILERGYISGRMKSDYSSGYADAYVDTQNQEQCGIGYVLGKIAALIQAHEREKYTSWVFSTYVDPLDRQLQVELKENIFTIYGNVLPEEMTKLSPVQCVRFYRELIAACISYQDIMAASTGA